jgi:hypothetical protein
MGDHSPRANLIGVAEKVHGAKYISPEEVAYIPTVKRKKSGIV